MLLKLTGPALDWWLDLQSLRDQQNKRHICAWSRIKKCLMERFLPHNYKQLLDEKYGSNQQNTTTLAKDVIEEIDKVVIEEVDDKKIETEVGDQVVVDQNSYLLEMVDTKICVKEEPTSLQVDHVDLDNWVLLTKDDFTENVPGNIRDKEDENIAILYQVQEPDGEESHESGSIISRHYDAYLNSEPCETLRSAIDPIGKFGTQFYNATSFLLDVPINSVWIDIKRSWNFSMTFNLLIFLGWSSLSFHSILVLQILSIS